MKVLIIKTSSMGDILHTLPALTQAALHHPSIEFDWVVEEAFAEIPHWHPRVRNVILFPWRRIRKQPFSRLFWRELRQFKQQLAGHYDYIIDAQGLVKSAFLTMFAQGLRCGGDFHSAREPLASLFYQKRVTVDSNQHAIARIRKLFAGILGYPYAETSPDYGIQLRQEKSALQPYVVFLHGTTWDTKHWPEAYWVALAKIVSAQGLQIKLLWGNAAEKARAQRISQVSPDAEVMPKMNLQQIAYLLAGARAAVAVDTGLAHLAAALAVPAVNVYGPTNPDLTGAQGEHQLHLRSQLACAPCLKDRCQIKRSPTLFPPCFVEITPERVMQCLRELL